MLTVAGAERFGEVLVTVATQPPKGADPDRFTVHVADPPGMTVVGVQLKLVIWKTPAMFKGMVAVLAPLAVIAAV